MSEELTPLTEPKSRRIIQLKPDAELARRIDVTAALASKSAPEYILAKLDAELPHFEPLQASTVEAVNGR